MEGEKKTPQGQENLDEKRDASLYEFELHSIRVLPPSYILSGFRSRHTSR